MYVRQSLQKVRDVVFELPVLSTGTQVSGTIKHSTTRMLDQVMAPHTMHVRLTWYWFDPVRSNSAHVLHVSVFWSISR